jgi:hypothetical protein
LFETNLQKLSVNTVSKSQKNPNYFFLFNTPVPFKNIGLLFIAFAQKGGIALWFGVGWNNLLDLII